ncbi:unnamed protein product [Cochlearia groenlandica]
MQDQAAYYQSMISKQQQQFTEQEEQLKCPRCDSPNTKFCYYNNYNLSQPRHFCKNCRRYWTKGGALRNVPVGGGSRKNNSKRSTTTSSSSPSCKKTKNPDPDPDLDSRVGLNPDPDPTRMLYGFPIGEQDVKGVESFSSLLASNMQMGGFVLDGSGLDPGMGLGLGRSEATHGNTWTDLSMNRLENN